MAADDLQIGNLSLLYQYLNVILDSVFALNAIIVCTQSGYQDTLDL